YSTPAAAARRAAAASLLAAPTAPLPPGIGQLTYGTYSPTFRSMANSNTTPPTSRDPILESERRRFVASSTPIAGGTPRHWPLNSGGLYSSLPRRQQQQQSPFLPGGGSASASLPLPPPAVGIIGTPG